MLIDKIPQEELNLFINYVNRFGPNSGSTVYRTCAAPEKLLSEWDKAKSEYLWYLMGEKFILEREVSYKEPTAKIRDRICAACSRDSISNVMRPFWEKYCDIINQAFPYWYSQESRVLRALIDYQSLATNKICGGGILPCNVEFSDGKKIKIEATTKPLRALGKIAKMFNLEEDFEIFRLEHSRILNQKELKGTLCLSIHPMDYLTMSDNYSKWTSCMNWREPGSYRMGTVEMMNSSMVLVAYLKSNDKIYDWNCGSWNDKHWRLLIVVTPNGIVSVKGYPYEHKELTKECLNWIIELGAKNLSWSFNDIAEIPDQEVFEYVDKNYYRMDSETYMMYNDFGAATHLGAFPVTFDTTATADDPIEVVFQYSGPSQCMCCGHTIESHNTYDESYVFCSDCCSNAEEEDYECCPHCGNSWYRDEMYWIEDNYVCPDCLPEVADECALEREFFYFENLIEVHLARVPDKPDIDDDAVSLHKQYYSRWVLPEEYFTIEHPREDREAGLYYFNKEDLTSEGLLRIYGLSDCWVQEYFNPVSNEE